MVGDFIGVPHDGLAPLTRSRLSTHRSWNPAEGTCPSANQTGSVRIVPHAARDHPARPSRRSGGRSTRRLVRREPSRRIRSSASRHSVHSERRLRLTRHQKLPGLITHPFYGSGRASGSHARQTRSETPSPGCFFSFRYRGSNSSSIAMTLLSPRRDHHVGLLRDGAAGVPKEPPGKQQEPTGHHRRNRPSRHPTDQGHPASPPTKGQAF